MSQHFMPLLLDFGLWSQMQQNPEFHLITWVEYQVTQKTEWKQSIYFSYCLAICFASETSNINND